MTMPRGVSRALYAGNGQAVEFPFLFKVWEEEQLSVLLTSPAGVTSEATGWTAELDESGGTVRYLHNGGPLPEGWKLAIMRDMPFVQEVDLITGTRFDPEVVETALDVATAERQQLLERLARAVVVEPTDEAGPEALLADIRDARTSAGVSATSAAANANAAAESARAAAGSCAVATEQREAACICAWEAKAARDAAIAQAEATNTLMEAELAKVNVLVAADRTDQQAAVTAARQWAEKEPDVPVEYDDDGNPLYSARHWAENAQKIALEPPTEERRGGIRVGDGLRLVEGDNGETDVLAVSPGLGGHLLLNDEVWLTESGTFIARATGWHEVLLITGGQGGFAHRVKYGSTWSGLARCGLPGYARSVLAYLTEGEEVPVVVGAGGLKAINDNADTPWGAGTGGQTSFGDITAYVQEERPRLFRARNSQDTNPNLAYYGAYSGDEVVSYGSGGMAQANPDVLIATDGVQGAVRVRFSNPAKAAGPAAAPATFAARRRAVAEESQAAAVTLYDPETGEGSVWKAGDAQAKLKDGLISREKWEEIRAEKTAAAHAEWLASLDTEAERFALLRRARDAKLLATDYLVAPDYPLADEQRAAVVAYRQALRDLPAQEGAPWDGGGGLTPWPARPGVQDARGALPCA